MEWRRFVTYLSNDPRINIGILSVGMSVCLSHPGIVLKRLNMSYFLQHIVALSL